MNSKDVDFPCSWLVVADGVNTSNVMIGDTTGVTDSVLLLFGDQVTPKFNHVQASFFSLEPWYKTLGCGNA